MNILLLYVTVGIPPNDHELLYCICVFDHHGDPPHPHGAERVVPLIDNHDHSVIAARSPLSPRQKSCEALSVTVPRDHDDEEALHSTPFAEASCIFAYEIVPLASFHQTTLEFTMSATTVHAVSSYVNDIYEFVVIIAPTMSCTLSVYHVICDVRTGIEAIVVYFAALDAALSAISNISAHRGVALRLIHVGNAMFVILMCGIKDTPFTTIYL